MVKVLFQKGLLHKMWSFSSGWNSSKVASVMALVLRDANANRLLPIDSHLLHQGQEILLAWLEKGIVDHFADEDWSDDQVAGAITRSAWDPQSVKEEMEGLSTAKDYQSLMKMKQRGEFDYVHPGEFAPNFYLEHVLAGE
jgi:hypothetical protein